MHGADIMPIRNGFGIIAPPLEVPATNIWLDGADASPRSMDFSGTALSGWNNKVGNINDFSQTTSLARPEYTENSRNVLSSIYFNGVDDYMRASNELGSFSDFFIFAVIKSSTSSSANPMIFAKYGVPGGNIATIHGRNNVGNAGFWVRDVNNDTLNVTLPIDTGWNLMFASRKADKIVFGLNGSDTIATGTCLAEPLNGASDIGLGAQMEFNTNNPIPSTFYKGLIGEFILGSHYIDNGYAEYNFLVTYLKNKWGLDL